jgi:hypothetical protein
MLLESPPRTVNEVSRFHSRGDCRLWDEIAGVEVEVEVKYEDEVGQAEIRFPIEFLEEPSSQYSSGFAFL